MRVALLCEVDQAVYHVGDEAIGIASAAQLRQRGHEVVMISRQEKYGPGGQPHAESIPALTFPWPLDERDRYLAEIRKVLSGNHVALPAKDKLFKIMNQLRGVDALVIGGGGSLNSNFGWLVYERLATALVASFLDIPVVLSGQSLGPFLLLSDRAALKELLELCQLVGVRDADSYRLATQLCPSIRRSSRPSTTPCCWTPTGTIPRPTGSASRSATTPNPSPNTTMCPSWLP